jgi:excisionase family DNA binding protein
VLERLALLADMQTLPPSAPVFLTQNEVAELLRLPVRTVEDWRLTRNGPPWLKLGRHVRYERDDLLEWVKGRRHG